MAMPPTCVILIKALLPDKCGMDQADGPDMVENYSAFGISDGNLFSGLMWSFDILELLFCEILQNHLERMEFKSFITNIVSETFVLCIFMNFSFLLFFKAKFDIPMALKSLRPSYAQHETWSPKKKVI